MIDDVWPCEGCGAPLEGEGERPPMQLTCAHCGDVSLRFRQSWLGEYLLCPERARQKWFGLVPDGPSDATAIGTGVHAGIEYILRGGERYDDAMVAAEEAFEIEMAHPHFRWVQVKTVDTVRRHIANCLDSWLTRVHPYLSDPIWIEQDFRFLLETVLIGADTVHVWLSGCIDYADEAGLWDWKTAKDLAKYTPGWGGEGWKLRRFGIQPTVYCLAAEELGLWDMIRPEGLDAPYDFTYVAMHKLSQAVATLEVERTPAHAEWLRKLCRNAAGMILSGLDEWPTIDQHALCSPEWCPAWAQCKGKFTEIA